MIEKKFNDKEEKMLMVRGFRGKVLTLKKKFYSLLREGPVDCKLNDTQIFILYTNQATSSW